ncbi:MAG: cytochrome C oxidase subunit IV family protein [Actinomycetota bacterium]
MSVEEIEAEALSHHPEPRTYITVAIILAIVTAIEVALSYASALGDLVVPLLIISALFKFALVALWFMHLRFDNRIFRRLFVTGIILALIVFSVFLAILFGRGGPVPLLID